MEKVLIVPGLRNSGPTHWQSWFETVLPNTRRVEQADWERTCLSDWAARVREAIDASPNRYGSSPTVSAAWLRLPLLLPARSAFAAPCWSLRPTRIALANRWPCLKKN